MAESTDELQPQHLAAPLGFEYDGSQQAEVEAEAEPAEALDAADGNQQAEAEAEPAEALDAADDNQQGEADAGVMPVLNSVEVADAEQEQAATCSLVCKVAPSGQELCAAEAAQWASNMISTCALVATDRFTAAATLQPGAISPVSVSDVIEETGAQCTAVAAVLKATTAAATPADAVQQDEKLALVRGYIGAGVKAEDTDLPGDAAQQGDSAVQDAHGLQEHEGPAAPAADEDVAGAARDNSSICTVMGADENVSLLEDHLDVQEAAEPAGYMQESAAGQLEEMAYQSCTAVEDTLAEAPLVLHTSTSSTDEGEQHSAEQPVDGRHCHVAMPAPDAEPSPALSSGGAAGSDSQEAAIEEVSSSNPEVAHAACNVEDDAGEGLQLLVQQVNAAAGAQVSEASPMQSLVLDAAGQQQQDLQLSVPSPASEATSSSEPSSPGDAGAGAEEGAVAGGCPLAALAMPAVPAAAVADAADQVAEATPTVGSSPESAAPVTAVDALALSQSSPGEPLAASIVDRLGAAEPADKSSQGEQSSAGAGVAAPADDETGPGHELLSAGPAEGAEAARTDTAQHAGAAEQVRPLGMAPGAPWAGKRAAMPAEIDQAAVAGKQVRAMIAARPSKIPAPSVQQASCSIAGDQAAPAALVVRNSPRACELPEAPAAPPAAAAAIEVADMGAPSFQAIKSDKLQAEEQMKEERVAAPAAAAVAITPLLEGAAQLPLSLTTDCLRATDSLRLQDTAGTGPSNHSNSSKADSSFLEPGSQNSLPQQQPLLDSKEGGLLWKQQVHEKSAVAAVARGSCDGVLTADCSGDWHIPVGIQAMQQRSSHSDSGAGRADAHPSVDACATSKHDEPLDVAAGTDAEQLLSARSSAGGCSSGGGGLQHLQVGTPVASSGGVQDHLGPDSNFNTEVTTTGLAAAQRKLVFGRLTSTADVIVDSSGSSTNSGLCMRSICEQPGGSGVATVTALEAGQDPRPAGDQLSDAAGCTCVQSQASHAAAGAVSTSAAVVAAGSGILSGEVTTQAVGAVQSKEQRQLDQLMAASKLKASGSKLCGADADVQAGHAAAAAPQGSAASGSLLAKAFSTMRATLFTTPLRSTTSSTADAMPARLTQRSSGSPAGVLKAAAGRPAAAPAAATLSKGIRQSGKAAGSSRQQGTARHAAAQGSSKKKTDAAAMKDRKRGRGCKTAGVQQAVGVTARQSRGLGSLMAALVLVVVLVLSGLALFMPVRLPGLGRARHPFDSSVSVGSLKIDPGWNRDELSWLGPPAAQQDHSTHASATEDMGRAETAMQDQMLVSAAVMADIPALFDEPLHSRSSWTTAVGPAADKYAAGRAVDEAGADRAAAAQLSPPTAVQAVTRAAAGRERGMALIDEAAAAQALVDVNGLQTVINEIAVTESDVTDEAAVSFAAAMLAASDDAPAAAVNARIQVQGQRPWQQVKTWVLKLLQRRQQGKCTRQEDAADGRHGVGNHDLVDPEPSNKVPIKFGSDAAAITDILTTAAAAGDQEDSAAAGDQEDSAAAEEADTADHAAMEAMLEHGQQGAAPGADLDSGHGELDSDPLGPYGYDDFQDYDVDISSDEGEEQLGPPAGGAPQSAAAAAAMGAQYAAMGAQYAARQAARAGRHMAQGFIWLRPNKLISRLTPSVPSRERGAVGAAGAAGVAGSRHSHQMSISERWLRNRVVTSISGPAAHSGEVADLVHSDAAVAYPPSRWLDGASDPRAPAGAAGAGGSGSPLRRSTPPGRSSGRDWGNYSPLGPAGATVMRGGGLWPSTAGESSAAGPVSPGMRTRLRASKLRDDRAAVVLDG
eukprot:gene11893-12037_t